MKASVKLDIQKVDICMQKNQLVNICRLVELDHEYTEMQDAYQMQQRTLYQHELAELDLEPEVLEQ